MPRPRPSSYPKEQRWRFVQRALTDEELLSFSAAIIRNHGRKIDDVLSDLLGFTVKGQTEYKKAWLDIWVNVMHQMGLGYTWKDGKYLYATELCHYLESTKDIKSYYLFWGLKFQFPFGYPKQKHYIDRNIAVQPVMLIFQYFAEIYRRTNDIQQVYLSKYEIVKYLMRSQNHDSVREDIGLLLSHRERGDNYDEEERMAPGFIEAGDHFFNRGRLFVQNIPLIRFSDDRIDGISRINIHAIERYLSLRKQPIVFKANTQDVRNHYFYLSYIELDPDPSIILSYIYTKKKIVADELLTRLKPIEDILNPVDTKGTFRKAVTLRRDFQQKLRKDLLPLYKHKCCICGLDLIDFLRTAHIVPVEVDPEVAADRTNCFMLCVLHDIAFENGYIFIDQDYTIKINKKYKNRIRHPIIVRELLERVNQKIYLPVKYKPKLEYFNRHKIINDIES